MSTLVSNDSTISEEVSIDYDENKVTIYDDYGDEMYAIKSNDNHETCHHDSNFQSHDSYFFSLLPLLFMRINKFSMLMDHENNALCDGYIDECIHDATENYYERGTL